MYPKIKDIEKKIIQLNEETETDYSRSLKKCNDFNFYLEMLDPDYSLIGELQEAYSLQSKLDCFEKICEVILHSLTSLLVIERLLFHFLLPMFKYFSEEEHSFESDRFEISKDLIKTVIKKLENLSLSERKVYLLLKYMFDHQKKFRYIEEKKLSSINNPILENLKRYAERLNLRKEKNIEEILKLQYYPYSLFNIELNIDYNQMKDYTINKMREDYEKNLPYLYHMKIVSKCELTENERKSLKELIINCLEKYVTYERYFELKRFGFWDEILEDENQRLKIWRIYIHQCFINFNSCYISDDIIPELIAKFGDSLDIENDFEAIWVVKEIFSYNLISNSKYRSEFYKLLKKLLIISIPTYESIISVSNSVDVENELKKLLIKKKHIPRRYSEAIQFILDFYYSSADMRLLGYSHIHQIFKLIDKYSLTSLKYSMFENHIYNQIKQIEDNWNLQYLFIDLVKKYSLKFTILRLLNDKIHTERSALMLLNC